MEHRVYMYTGGPKIASHFRIITESYDIVLKPADKI